MDINAAKKELDISEKRSYVAAKNWIQAKENFESEKRKIIDLLILLDEEPTIN